MTVQAPKVRRAAEPLYEKDLPDTPCITLDKLIDLIATHGVEIPEEECIDGAAVAGRAQEGDMWLKES